MNTVHELPKSSSHRLTSAQVITSVFSAVKELVENALDSSCTNIEVKLDNYGLEKIEVRDNGSGIKTVDISFVARSHYTSKIKSHLDLEKIQTYGFRGEALSALCSLSNMTIATKTADEDIGKLCQIGQNGDIVSSKPLPCNQGTVVAVSNLFCNVPVRKQYYKSEKRKKEELKNVEDILIAFACAKPNVRFTLYHNKNMIWQKSSVNNIRDVLFQVFGDAALRCMEFVDTLNEELQIKMEAYLPKAGTKCATMVHTTADRCIVLVNKRPVRMKAIDKLLHETYSKSHENESRAKYPICYVSMTLSSNSIDINFEPNKTEVLFYSSEQVLGMLSDMLNKFYKLDSPASCNKNMEAIAVKKNNSSTAEVQHIASTINNPLPKEDLADIIRNLGKDSIKSQAAPTSCTKHKENNTTQNMIVSISNESVTESKKNKKTKRDNLNATATPTILNHVRTLKNFFCPPETTPVTESVLSRNSAVRTSLNEHASKHNSDTESKENEVVAQGRKRRFSDSSLLSSQSSQKQPKVGLSRAANWSRGAAWNEKNVQPVGVLMPNITKLDSGANKFDNVKPRAESENLCMGKDFSRLQKSDEMVALNTVPVQNQPFPIRQISCFDYFCRNKRLEVASLHPEYNNRQIAQVLSKMWNDLAEEVKDKYKNYASNGSPKNLQSREKLMKSVCSKSPKATIVFTATAKRVKTRKPFRSKREELNITFSMEHLKSVLTSRSKPCPKNTFAQQEIKIINSLAPGVWIYAKDKKLSLLNSFRLQETILYHRLLETHELKPEPLPQPIQIFSSALNSSEILFSLSEIDDGINGHSVSDKRITANGFAISLLKSTDEALVKISCVTNKIPFYGVSDLTEVLQILKTKGTTVPLSECRPLKVVFYLQGEAVRIARQCCIPSKSDVEDILTQRKWLPTKCEKCIHDKPFSYELCTLDM